MNLNTTILALLGKAQKNTLPKFWSSNRLYKFGDLKQKKEQKKDLLPLNIIPYRKVGFIIK